eukprot:m.321427 g.321427  ORF g.321427 m.321427 type:complete len:640 (+) comp15996_c1_seq27:294-2213(+)
MPTQRRHGSNYALHWPELALCIMSVVSYIHVYPENSEFCFVCGMHITRRNFRQLFSYCSIHFFSQVLHDTFHFFLHLICSCSCFTRFSSIITGSQHTTRKSPPCLNSSPNTSATMLCTKDSASQLLILAAITTESAAAAPKSTSTKLKPANSQTAKALKGSSNDCVAVPIKHPQPKEAKTTQRYPKQPQATSSKGSSSATSCPSKACQTTTTTTSSSSTSATSASSRPKRRTHKRRKQAATTTVAGEVNDTTPPPSKVAKGGANTSPATHKAIAESTSNDAPLPFESASVASATLDLVTFATESAAVNTVAQPNTTSLQRPSRSRPTALQDKSNVLVACDKHTCSFCGKRFSTQAHVTRHERVHTGEQPFPCPHCPKRFNQQGNLNVHLRTHTGDRPYECCYCHKSFTTSSYRSVHERSHERAQDFQQGKKPASSNGNDDEDHQPQIRPSASTSQPLSQPSVTSALSLQPQVQAHAPVQSRVGIAVSHQPTSYHAGASLGASTQFVQQPSFSVGSMVSAPMGYSMMPHQYQHQAVQVAPFAAATQQMQAWQAMATYAQQQQQLHVFGAQPALFPPMFAGQPVPAQQQMVMYPAVAPVALAPVAMAPRTFPAAQPQPMQVHGIAQPGLPSQFHSPYTSFV